MRTKTLLLTAAFVAAGVATSMAQVYSQNVVGYVNVSITNASPTAPTYAVLANPLNGTNNNINTVLPSVPVGTQVFKFDPVGGFTTVETYFGAPLGWDPGTSSLVPGEGFFVALDPAAPSPTQITFVGEVPQGTLANPVAPGFNLKSSVVPQTGGLTSVLGLTPAVGDQLYIWNVPQQQYTDVYTYFGGALGWDPFEPVIQVGQGFFIFNASGSTYPWTRTFTVQ